MSHYSAETCVLDGDRPHIPSATAALSNRLTHPLGTSTTTTITDAADSCGRAMQRWHRVLDEQAVLLGRLIEKTVASPSPSLRSAPSTLAAAGLPVRLLHVRVQSNLHSLEAQVHKALAPFARFHQSQPLPRSRRRADDTYTDEPLSTSTSAQACHRITCIVSELRELCDLQADATRGFDAQLRSSTSTSATSSCPADLLRQMHDLTASMRALSHTLWDRLQGLLRAFPALPRADVASRRSTPSPPSAAEGTGTGWLTDVIHANDTAESLLNTCVSPPTRGGSLDPGTAAVFVASPSPLASSSPLARRLQWPNVAVSDDKDADTRNNRHAHSSSPSASPIEGRSHRTAARSAPRDVAFASLSPWKSEDERCDSVASSPAPLAVVAKAAASPPVPPLRERPSVNAPHTSHKVAAPEGFYSAQCAHLGDYTTYLDADHAVPPPATEHTWSIPPPLAKQQHRPDKRVCTSQSEQRSFAMAPLDPPRVAPSTVHYSSVSDHHDSEPREDGHTTCRDGDDPPHTAGHSPRLLAPRTPSRGEAGQRERASPVPSSPLTNQALQALRTSYDRRTAELESALREREGVIADLKRQAQQPVERVTAQSPPPPPWTPPLADQDSRTPPPPPYDVASTVPVQDGDSTMQSFTQVQRELEAVRRQQAHLLSLLQARLSEDAPQEARVAPTAGAATVASEPTASTQPTHHTTRVDEPSDAAAIASELRAIQDRNDRLQRDNIRLKKQLFAAESDLRRATHQHTTVAPSAATMAQAGVSDRQRRASYDEPERGMGDAVESFAPDRNDAFTFNQPQPRQEAPSVRDRRRAILEKLFSHRRGPDADYHSLRVPTSEVASAWQEREAAAAEGSLGAGRGTAARPSWPHSRSSSFSSPFVVPRPFFPFGSDRSLASSCRAASAPPSAPPSTNHPYGGASTVSAPGGGRVRETSLRGAGGGPLDRRRSARSEADARAPSTTAATAFPSGLPQLRHQAWRVGDDRVETAALELLSRPIGRAAARFHADSTQPHDRVDDTCVAPTPRSTTPPLHAGLSPLQAQRERVWRSLHTLSAANVDQPHSTVPSRAHAERQPVTEWSENVFVSPLTERGGASPGEKSEADIVSVTVEEPVHGRLGAGATEAETTGNGDDITMSADRRFPLPAYMYAPSRDASSRTSRGDDGHRRHESSEPMFEPTLLKSPPPRFDSGTAQSERSTHPHAVVSSSNNPANRLFDPLRPLTLPRQRTVLSHSPPPRTAQDERAVGRQLSLSHSHASSVTSSARSPDGVYPARTSSSSSRRPAARRALSASPSPPPPHTASASHPLMAADPARRRSRTLPPTTTTEHPDAVQQAGGREATLRAAGAKGDFMRALVAERAELTATLRTLHAQREQIAEKRTTLHRLLSSAKAEGQRGRAEDLHRLLERLEEASRAVSTKVTQLYAERERVAQQLQLLQGGGL